MVVEQPSYDGPAASVATMLKLAVAVVAIALADCINPSLIGGELFVATGEHPRQQTVVFARIRSPSPRASA
jgi:hypothetical protein